MSCDSILYTLPIWSHLSMSLILSRLVRGYSVLCSSYHSYKGVPVCSAILDDRLAVCIKTKMHILFDQAIPLLCYLPSSNICTWANADMTSKHDTTATLFVIAVKPETIQMSTNKGMAKLKIFPYCGIQCNSSNVQVISVYWV